MEMDFDKLAEQNVEILVEALKHVLQSSSGIILEEFFPGNIMDKAVLITGNGPYDEDNLSELVGKLGGILDDPEVPWEDISYAVIGREDFDEEHLEDMVKNIPEVTILSQDAFLDYMLFGNEIGYYSGDERIEDHPGLLYVSEIGFKWPSTGISETVDGEIEGEDWKRVSDLKDKFGYNVSKQAGLTAQQRRMKLDAAIKPSPKGLGLEKVANHIASMVRLSKRRKKNPRKSAISKWESDLEWLKANHYSKTKDSFIWPRY